MGLSVRGLRRFRVRLLVCNARSKGKIEVIKEAFLVCALALPAPETIAWVHEMKYDGLVVRPETQESIVALKRFVRFVFGMKGAA